MSYELKHKIFIQTKKSHNEYLIEGLLNSDN